MPEDTTPEICQPQPETQEDPMFRVLSEPQRQAQAVRAVGCPRCQDSGHPGMVETPTGYAQCRCSRVRDVLQALPAELSPYLRGGVNPLSSRYITESLVIHGDWDAVAPVVTKSIADKLFTLDKPSGFRVKVTHDLTLLNMNFEHEEDGSTRLKGLVHPNGCDLLVLRLGFLGVRNIAAPDALYKALQYRDGHATWVIIDDSTPYQKGYYGWSELVDSHLRNPRFGQIRFDPCP